MSGEKEPLYYCYVTQISPSTSNVYYYAKSPLTNGGNVHCHTMGAVHLAEVSTNLKLLDVTWSDLSKDVGIYYNSSRKIECTRYYEGDLYE